MNKILPHRPENHSEETSMLAYFLWEQAHCPPGQELHFWLEAERQLFGTRAQQPAGKPKAAARPASATAGNGPLRKGRSAIKSSVRQSM